MIKLSVIENYSFEELEKLIEGKRYKKRTTDLNEFKKEYVVLKELASKEYSDDTVGNEAKWVEYSGNDLFFINDNKKLCFVKQSQTGIFIVGVYEDIIIDDVMVESEDIIVELNADAENKVEVINSEENTFSESIENTAKETIRKILLIQELTKDNKELLLSLSKDESLKVRIAVANSPFIDDEIFSILVDAENQEICNALAKNLSIKNVSDKLQIDFFGRADYCSGKLLAKNPNISTLLMQKIADCNYSLIRSSLFENPNLDETSIKLLTFDTNEDISKKALKLFRNKFIDKMTASSKSESEILTQKKPSFINKQNILFLSGLLLAETLVYLFLHGW